jgi:hypothetical protein
MGKRSFSSFCQRVWSIYGTGEMELSHVTLTGIKLDKTPPTGSLSISKDYTTTTTVELTLLATDTTSGIGQMRFSNDNITWSDWEQYYTSKSSEFAER